MYAAPALTLKCRQIEELNACWNGVIRKIFGYSRFESVKRVIHGLGRLSVKHLFMLRKIKFYRHSYLSENFLHNLFCVRLVHNVDDCMKSVFTARRYASAVLAVVVCLSVCLCVCLSVTSRYCIKTAIDRITQTTPHDSTGKLVFWYQNSFRNSNWVTPNGGAKWRSGRVKSANFDK